MKWIINEGVNARKHPEWARRCAIEEDGTIFFPAGTVANEVRIILEIGWDGNQNVIMDSKHLYVPIDWLIANYPKAKPYLEEIKNNIQDREART